METINDAFASLIQRRLDYGKKCQKRDVDRYRIHVQHLIGSLSPSAVTKQDVDQVVLRTLNANGQRPGRKNCKTQANRVLDLIRAILNHAGVSSAPAQGRRLKLAPKRDFIEPVDMAHLLKMLTRDALERRQQAMICMLMLFTGLRKSNAMCVEWGWLKGSWLHVPSCKTKNSQQLKVWLHPFVFDHLERFKTFKKRPENRIFDAKCLNSYYADLSSRLSKKCGKDLKINGPILRRTFAVYAVAAEVHSKTISAMLGHITPTIESDGAAQVTFQIYMHSPEGSVQTGFERVGDLILRSRDAARVKKRA